MNLSEALALVDELDIASARLERDQHNGMSTTQDEEVGIYARVVRARVALLTILTADSDTPYVFPTPLDTNTSTV